MCNLNAKKETETNTPLFTFAFSAERVWSDHGKEKRVRMNEVAEVVTVKKPENTRVAQVPSFYIGKPLVDHDARIKKRNRIVSQTFYTSLYNY